MPDKLLLIANEGTSSELTIFSTSDGLFLLDNTPEREGRTWYELPRIYRSIRACKVAAANILGEPQSWSATAQGE